MFTFGLLSTHLPYLVMAFFSCCLFLMPLQQKKVQEKQADEKSILLSNQEITSIYHQAVDHHYYFAWALSPAKNQVPPLPDLDPGEPNYLQPQLLISEGHSFRLFCRPPPIVS